MPKREKILLSWNGGMEAAIALFELKSPEYTLKNLVTAVEVPSQRLPFSGIRRSLIQKQAESLQMNILFAPLPEKASNSDYEKAIGEMLTPIKKKGLDGVAFTDVQLEDMRSYRQRLMESFSLKSYQPLWGWDVKEVLRVFFSLGYKAVVAAVDLKKLPPPFLGREFDREFIDSLPSGISPFGEHGEFSTFVYDGPFFQTKISTKKGQIAERDGFAFQDLE